MPDQSPQLRARLPRERLIAGGMLLAWLVLAGRLIQLNLGSGDDFEKAAARQRIYPETVPARPGDIVDRYGHVFATSVSVKSVYVVPAKLRQGWKVTQQLAETLNLDADLLFERIASHPSRQFLWIKRRITDEEAEKIRDLKLPPDVCGFREEFRRHYPQGIAAAQVIGLRNLDGEGQGGIEQSFDKPIRGKDGVRDLILDARGRVLEVRDETQNAPRHGETVVLTLDAVIQVFAEKALDGVMTQWKPKSACAVVLDPKTGGILAMASRPTFDPNEPERIPPEAWKNRAICDTYEPGSTFKPFVVAWGLQHQCMQQDEMFNCENGEYRMGRRLLHDHHPYGRLNVVDILVKSSNIGMAKIGERMGNSRLYQSAVAFGFGGRTGIEIPGELPGKLRPLKQWNSYSTGSIPMGQELAATPLQILTAYGALANEGTLITPHLVIKEPQMGGTARQVIVSHAVEPAIAGWIRKTALTAVVSRGTGKKAAIRGYEVFGKTGTAQKLDPQTGLYSKELHMSSFVCGAPADDPRALIIIAVDEPSVSLNGEHFGGSVAAPAAGELLRQTLLQLRVPPDEQLLRSAQRESWDDDTVLE